MKHIKAIPDHQVTPQAVWEQRRLLLKLLGTTTLMGSMCQGWAGEGVLSTEDTQMDLVPTPEAAVLHYNNYYEFSFEKSEPSKLASALQTEPWALEITGLVEKPLRMSVDDLQRRFTRVDRIYRFRCVEGWSAVLPWGGFLLRDLLLQAAPLSSARFVAFTAISAPEVMPNQAKNKLLNWPYREALRLDEALHPLTLMATGLYGKPLSPQNGAPLRLVVPWKYGFKSIKAVVRIELLEKMPPTTWNENSPHEYGFYANVNPDVPHPRWSQATERPLASALHEPRSKTRLFNGYADQVAGLYSAIDLKRFF